MLNFAKAAISASNSVTWISLPRDVPLISVAFMETITNDDDATGDKGVCILCKRSSAVVNHSLPSSNKHTFRKYCPKIEHHYYCAFNSNTPSHTSGLIYSAMVLGITRTKTQRCFACVILHEFILECSVCWCHFVGAEFLCITPCFHGVCISCVRAAFFICPQCKTDISGCFVFGTQSRFTQNVRHYAENYDNSFCGNQEERSMQKTIFDSTSVLPGTRNLFLHIETGLLHIIDANNEKDINRFKADISMKQCFVDIVKLFVAETL